MDWPQLHVTLSDPDSKATEITKEAHIAFCRSAPHWEAHHRHWEFFAVANPCNTILCCCAVEESPSGRGLQGGENNTGKASSAVGSLPQVTTNSNKPHLILVKTSYNLTDSRRPGFITLKPNIFFYRSIWAIWRWRYESWTGKGNKSSEKWQGHEPSLKCNLADGSIGVRSQRNKTFSEVWSSASGVVRREVMPKEEVELMKKH